MFEFKMALHAKEGHVTFIVALVLDHPSYSDFTAEAWHLAVLVFISLDWAARSILTCT